MLPTRIEISPSAVIGEVEKDFFPYYNATSYENSWLIDLQNVAFIEIASMVYIAQLIYKRKIADRETKIVLPESAMVMVILHTWRFFGIIEELTGSPITHYIYDDSNEIGPVKIEIEGKTYYKDINCDYFDKYYTEEGIQRLVKKGFFSLVCLPFKTEKEKRYALKSQRLHWKKETLIADVLERNLLHQVEVGNLLANTLIYECLTNAARHPKSDKLVIGSFFDFKKASQKDVKEFHFTIVIWDNGDSIINTLKHTLQSNENIRSKESFELAINSGLTSWYKLKRAFPTKSVNENLFYDFIPNKETVDEEILVASLLPGITRDPERKQPLFIKDESIGEDERTVLEEAIEIYGPGLGLTFLIDSVVGRLNGTLSIRTNEYFMNVKRANRNVLSEYKKLNGKPVESCYQAKLIKNSINASDFIGNMITIRIPIKNNQ